MLKNSWLPKPLRWALAVFACYRLARMISREEGPAAIFDTLRAAAGAYEYGESGEPLTNLGRGIVCPLCVGIYVAALIVLLVRRPTSVGDFFIAWMGISGAHIFVVKAEEQYGA